MQIWFIILISATVHVQHPQATKGEPLTLLHPYVVGSETYGDKLACESALTRFALDPTFDGYRDGFSLRRDAVGLIARNVVNITTEQAECYPLMAPSVQKRR